MLNGPAHRDWARTVSEYLLWRSGSVVAFLRGRDSGCSTKLIMIPWIWSCLLQEGPHLIPGGKDALGTLSPRVSGCSLHLPPSYSLEFSLLLLVNPSVNKRVQNAVLGCSLKTNDLGLFPRQTIQHQSNLSQCLNYWCQRSWHWPVLWRPTTPSRTNTKKKKMSFSS